MHFRLSCERGLLGYNGCGCRCLRLASLQPSFGVYFFLLTGYNPGLYLNVEQSRPRGARVAEGLRMEKACLFTRQNMRGGLEVTKSRELGEAGFKRSRNVSENK